MLAKKKKLLTAFAFISVSFVVINAYSFEKCFLLLETSPYKFVVNPTHYKESWQYDGKISQVSKKLEDAGYIRYEGQSGSFISDDFYLLINDHELALNSNVHIFIHTLQTEMPRLTEVMKISSREYFELVQLAFGILEVETKFGRSPKFWLKELFPKSVSLAKRLVRKNMSANSRGLTQIKKIPQSIETHYGYKPSDLNAPEAAAITTIGYLVDAISELHGKIERYNVTSVDLKNFYEHLIYIYTGRSSQLINNTATPDKNIYIKKIRKRRASIVVYYR